MNNPDPSASSEKSVTELESSRVPKGRLPGVSDARPDTDRLSSQTSPGAKPLKIVVRIGSTEVEGKDEAKVGAETSLKSELPSVENDHRLLTTGPLAEVPLKSESPHVDSYNKQSGLSGSSEEAQVIPARMMNEFVYCPRLFYYEFVEGVFVESADTLRGAAMHRRVDSGSGALPKAGKKAEVGGRRSEDRGQRAEGRSQRTVGRSQGTEERKRQKGRSFIRGRCRWDRSGCG